MLNIDGSQKSGSGTIVRYAVGLAALLGEELELTNIRAKKEKPGLRIQHLAAIKALAELCSADIEGGKIGASRIVFRPKSAVRSGSFQWDIGTAGSTTMFALTLLPLIGTIRSPLHLQITGGLFQDFAPSAFHMQNVLIPTLGKMGIKAEFNILRPGYVPRGAGAIELKLHPLTRSISPLILIKRGKVTHIQGTALSSHLEKRRVSERMVTECEDVLKKEGYQASIRAVHDESAAQAGAALAVFAYTEAGSIIGADGSGALGRTAEQVSRNVARSLIEDLSSNATVDRFLADQLIIFAALANGTSAYQIPRMTQHVDTNLWIVEKVLGAKSRLRENLLEIDGIGFAGAQG